MDSVGHSGTHAPQAMQSSRIFIVMVIAPKFKLRAAINYRLAMTRVNGRISFIWWILSQMKNVTSYQDVTFRM